MLRRFFHFHDPLSRSTLLRGSHRLPVTAGFGHGAPLPARSIRHLPNFRAGRLGSKLKHWTLNVGR